jgi:hypothetical protein
LAQRHLYDLSVQIELLERHLEPARFIAPVGRAWVIVAPSKVNTFITRVRFTLSGVAVEPDEIVIPSIRFWAHRDQPLKAARESGALGWVAQDLLAWICPCDRLFATQSALTKHGCSQLPPADTELSDGRLPELKGRNAQYARLWREGRTATEIAEHYGVNPETVEKRIVELRRTHGHEVIPYHRLRRS